jgi:alpha-methylacyl-CoA racemase
MNFLQGVTVLNLASVGPAARAAQTLADFGANVIHIVPVSAGVQIAPEFYAYGAGRGTRRMVLNLKAEQGKAVFFDLVRESQVLIESFRPGVVNRLGIDYDKVHQVNARLVYCSTSGYGQDGPYSQRAGHDINYLAMSGYLDCSGRDREGRPVLPGATVADSAGGGMHACVSILAALLAGEGCYLDVAVCEGVLSLMSLHIDKYLATGVANTSGSDLLTGQYAWYGIYRCKDEQFLAVGAIEHKFYANLCRLLGLDRFIDQQYELSIQPQLRKCLQDLFLSRERDHWTALLADQDTCVTPVLSVSEVTSDSHFRQRGNFQWACHGSHGDFQQLGRVLAGTDRGSDTHVGKTPSDSRNILSACGYNATDTEELITLGIIE